MAMQKFLCTHTMLPGAMSYEQICQLGEALQHDLSVRGYRSFINASEGTACCVLEANDREAIAVWFQKMQVPFDSIVAVEFEGDRGVIEDLRHQPAVAGVA
jgi:hypothetical protein